MPLLSCIDLARPRPRECRMTFSDDLPADGGSAIASDSSLQGDEEVRVDHSMAVRKASPLGPVRRQARIASGNESNQGDGRRRALPSLQQIAPGDDLSSKVRRRDPGASGLEVWGGVECTVNRVRDQYFD